MIAIKEQVTVRADGVIEIRSSRLKPGQRAQVIILTDPSMSEPITPEGSSRWQQFAGAIDSGDPRSGDNSGIDADLSEEYAADEPEQ